MLHSLPLELVFKIVEESCQKDRLSMRSTCRVLNHVAEEIVFSTLSLTTSHVKQNIGLIDDLVNNTITIGRFVKRLAIITTQDDEASDDDLSLLLRALRAFPCVKDVAWTCLVRTEPNLLRDIAASIARLPCLNTLTLSFGDIALPPLPFCDLKALHATFNGPTSWGHFMRTSFPSIIAASPRLRALSLSNPLTGFGLGLRGLEPRPVCQTSIRELYLRRVQMPIMLPETDDTPSLRALSSLSLRDVPNASDIWPVLQRQQICLAKVDVDKVSESLVDYLSSYSGLQEIILRCEDDSPASDRLAVRFWREVISQHRNTLNRVAVSPVFEGAWCVGPHAEEGILQCTNLQTLEVSLRFEEVRDRFACLLKSVPKSLTDLVAECPPMFSPRNGAPPAERDHVKAKKLMEEVVLTSASYKNDPTGGWLDVAVMPFGPRLMMERNRRNHKLVLRFKVDGV